MFNILSIVLEDMIKGNSKTCGEFIEPISGFLNFP